MSTGTHILREEGHCSNYAENVLSVNVQFFRPGDQPQEICASQLSTKACLHLRLIAIAGVLNAYCFL
jgi:hypothetical protein